MLGDISAPALEKAKAKVLELVPSAKIETQVRSHPCASSPHGF